MKIPTKHINTKQTLLAMGALVAIIGVAAPSAALAHGGSNGNDRDGRTASYNKYGNSKATYANNGGKKTDSSYGKHHRWGGNYDAQKWWGRFSAEDFQKYHDAKLAKLDNTIAKHGLTVENGDTLRAELVTNADELKVSLAALEQLRASIDKTNITDEQKAALKAQTLTTFESFYDYYESLYSFKAAIKVAADSKGANAEVDLEKED